GAVGVGHRATMDLIQPQWLGGQMRPQAGTIALHRIRLIADVAAQVEARECACAAASLARRDQRTDAGGQPPARPQ
ncbi:hypothetical protein RZS08_14765, partial [Arthrospira platensis SPKY1]|nr:hypothetical protein [Arthrospira platensis SPKY1]